ncbi:MAG: NUDIX domain-containing protein, partial [Tepidisphaeraceae bacterium]
SNAACTHPHNGESPLTAAERCLREELGVGAALRAAFRFRYRAAVPPGFIEHEYDHVFVGTLDGAPNPPPHEVAAWRAVLSDELARELVAQPEAFTVWFRLALPLFQHWREHDAERWENPFFDTTASASNT